MSDKPMPFFVYGTLMMGGGLSRSWVDDVNRVEQRVIVEGYTLYVTTGYFPYAVKSGNPLDFVWGELLWPASDEAAGLLTRDFDRIEGHPEHYTRTDVDVVRDAKSTEKAWMYAVTLERISYGMSQPTEIGASWREHVRKCEQREAQARQAVLITP